MKVAVKLFAGAREAAGASEAVVELADGATAGELRRALSEQWPALAALAASSLIAVNAEYAAPSSRVTAGDEVALIPPVSGG